MFSDLLLTHDKKTNKFVGGGYTLNSSFLNAGIPPLLQTGGKKAMSKSKSRSRSRSRSLSPLNDAAIANADTDTDNTDTMKVSSLLERNTGSTDALVIPAGLFMIHADIAVKTDDNTNKDESLSKNIERFLYDGPEVTSSYSDVDDVVPDDLYERLFLMLSPSKSEAKQYWHPKAATRSNHGKGKPVHPGGKSRTTRRIKPRN